MAGETMNPFMTSPIRPVTALVNTLIVFTLLLIAGTATAQEDAPAAESAQAAAAPTAEGDAGANAEAKAESTEAESPDPAAAETEKTEEELPPPPPPFHLRPYSVAVDIAFAENCLAYGDQQDEVIQDVGRAVRRMYGQMWEADVRSGNWLIPGSQGRIESLVEEDLIERFPERDFHKAFFVAVEKRGTDFHITCREFDTRIQELTTIYTDSTNDDRAIGEITARLIRDAFRPCLLFVSKFNNGEREVIEMQVQAGELLPPDPSATQVQPGDVLRTFLRQMDRRDPFKLKLLRAMPLSYVKVLSIGPIDIPESEDPFADAIAGIEVTPYEEAPGRFFEVGRSTVTGFFLTHMPMSPWGGKSRRMEHFAVRQRPAAQDSRVRLVLRSRPDKPLIAHRLALAYQLHWKDPEDPEMPQVQLVSDRNGEVVIPTNLKHPTFWIRVYSGRSLLARVPYAPGVIPFDVVELPNDSERLNVEGELKLLEDELIDSIALRGVLLARAEGAAKKGNKDDVEKFLGLYNETNGKQYFLDKSTNILVPARNAIKARGMRALTVERLVAAFQTTVNEFFSDEKRAARQKRVEKIKLQVGLE